MTPKVGYAYGKCSRCGREFRVRKPAPQFVLCDCYRYCPLENWTQLMTPFSPDLTPSLYGAEKAFNVKGGGAEPPEWTSQTLYACYNHSPPYYSKQKPVEVRLR